MAPEPVTAEFVYRRVRLEIVEGAFTPGMILKLGGLTDRFGTSATPVRDAMHRLVGERFVELLPGGGFRVRPLDPRRLAGLYQWHGQLLQLALGTPLSQTARDQVSALGRLMTQPQDVASMSAALFGLLAAASRNEELAQALELTSCALARARALEHHLFPSIVDDVSRLIAALETSDIGATRRVMARYHRDRVRLAPDIHKMIQK